MRVFVLYHFLTLVLLTSLASAAPSAKVKESTSPYDASDDSYLQSIPREDFAKPKTLQVSMGVGFAGGSYIQNDTWPQGPILNIRVALLKKSQRPQNVFDLDFHAKEFFSLGFGRKFYVNDTDIYDPYALLQAQVYSEFDEALGGIMKIDRWRLRAGIGFGRTFFFETGAGLAVVGPDLYLKFGIKSSF